MVTFGEGFTSGVRESVCSWLDDADANLRGWGESTLGVPTPNPVLSGVKAALCNRPPLPATSPPAAAGGQCPVSYQVDFNEQWEIRRCSDDSVAATRNQFNPGSATYQGPLTFTPTFRKEYESCGDGSVSAWLVGGTDATGAPFSTGPQNQDTVGRYVSRQDTTAQFRRVDGAADDCGDPPPPSTPPDVPGPGWRLPDFPLEYDTPDGTPVNVNVTPILFAPTVNIDGTLSIPVVINAPTLNVGANINLGPGGVTNVGFNFRVGTGDTVVDAPPPPNPPAITPPTPDPEDNERRIIGCVVTVTELGDTVSGEIFQSGGNPNVYIPDLGLVAFAISAGPEGFGWTEDIRVKNVKQYVPCPAPQGALNVSGTPRNGVVWTLTPVFGGRSKPFSEPVA